MKVSVLFPVFNTKEKYLRKAIEIVSRNLCKKEIRDLIYTTNSIESFNGNMRKYTKNKPTFPSEESLAKSLFLGILKVEKKRVTKVQSWGIIYSQLTILFSDRLANFGSLLCPSYTKS